MTSRLVWLTAFSLLPSRKLDIFLLHWRHQDRRSPGRPHLNASRDVSWIVKVTQVGGLSSLRRITEIVIIPEDRARLGVHRADPSENGGDHDNMHLSRSARLVLT